MIKTEKLKIRCLSHPSFDSSVFDNFLLEENIEWHKSSTSTDSEALIEASGRICYMAFGEGKQSGKSNSEYIWNLIEMGHESVLEHINWSFLITGVSRAFTHQLVRHRVGFAYSQLSQQYHDESEATFVVPPSVEKCAKSFAKWKESISSSISIYKELIKTIESDESLDSMVKKERLREIRSASRSILPNATETKIMVTVNARALRHFFKMRGELDGDWEMRAVSCELYRQVISDAPAAFQDFELEQLKDKSFKLLHYRK
jgi:thymidylate synthase (FAD)